MPQMGTLKHPFFSSNDRPLSDFVFTKNETVTAFGRHMSFRLSKGLATKFVSHDSQMERSRILCVREDEGGGGRWPSSRGRHARQQLHGWDGGGMRGVHPLCVLYTPTPCCKVPHAPRCACTTLWPSDSATSSQFDCLIVAFRLPQLVHTSQQARPAAPARPAGSA